MRSLIKLKQNKKAFLRIVEAFISIILVMGVLLVVLSRQPNFQPTQEEELQRIQRSILDQAIQDPEIRAEVLTGSESAIVSIKQIVGKLLPEGYSYDIKTCDLGTLEEICSLDYYVAEEVFVEETIISSSLTNYQPTIVKLFFWRGGYPEEVSGETQTSCGDGKCNSDETEETCPGDCSFCILNYKRCLGNMVQTCIDLGEDGYGDEWANTKNCKPEFSTTDEICIESGNSASCGVPAPECTLDSDCSTGEICSVGSCVWNGAILEVDLTTGTPYSCTTDAGPGNCTDYSFIVSDTNNIGGVVYEGQSCFDKPEYHCNFPVPIPNLVIPWSRSQTTAKSIYPDDKLTWTYKVRDINENELTFKVEINFP